MSSSTALVTGATGGIGVHIAREFAEQGWTVLVGARDAARGAEVAVQVGRPLLLDVTNADSIAAAAASVSKLDVLVNNAGISLDTGARVTETDVEVFRRTYETKRVRRGRSHQRVFAGAAPLRASAHRQHLQRHRIADLEHGPQSAVRDQAAGTGSGAAYRSSKTALDALTVFYAQALAHDGFKVNALAPGLRATNLNPRAAAAGGDPAEAAAGAVRLALLPDDGPTGQLSPGTGRLCRGERHYRLLARTAVGNR